MVRPPPPPRATPPPQAAPALAASPDKFSPLERKYVFTMLVSELSKQDIVSAVAGSELLRRFAGGDGALERALDKYEAGRDIEQLVGTLKGMCAV